MIVKTALELAKKNLSSLNISCTQLDAEILLLYAINHPETYRKENHYNKAWLYANLDYELSDSMLKLFNSLIQQRVEGKPIAYITNHKEFYGLDFCVNERVLIPRPETELIVEEVIKLTKQNKPDLIIDIGTGSGAVAISLAKNLPNQSIIASDISADALEVAKLNSKNNQTKNIEFYQGDLLEAVPNSAVNIHKSTIIVANLPYLTQGEFENEPSIHHEPKSALVANDQGLSLIKNLLDQINNLLKSYNLNLTTILEHNPHQTQKLHQIIQNILPKANVQTHQDLAGKDRITVIKIEN